MIVCHLIHQISLFHIQSDSLMKAGKRKVILYIAMSLDGYIARNDGDISWLNIVEELGEDYGYAAFIESIDTVILGRKTYEKVLSFGIDFPHKDKQCYVITSDRKPGQENIVFYTGDLSVLLSKLRQEVGKNIFIDGGAQLVNSLMQLDAIDEYIISLIPVLLGKGIQLFQPARSEQRLRLINSVKFRSGLVQLHYLRENHNQESE
jgi:dihydrofolate reductase